VRLIHQREHHHLDNQSSEEVRQQEAHLHKEQQLEEPVQASTSQVSTPRGGGSSSVFRMAGHDPTIRLPEFQGEATEDPEKHLFICAKIWEEKQITDEDTKLAQLAITLRDRALDWYMSLDTNSAPGMTRTLADIKKLLD
jgi:hypothetical protein